MDENKEIFANEEEAPLTEAQENELQEALREGFLGGENDPSGADETDPDDEDGFIFEAEREDGNPTEKDADGRAEPGSADSTAGRSGENDANGAAGAADAGAGEAKEGADAPAAGAAEKSADAAAPQPGEEPKYKVQLGGRELEMTVSELVAAAQKGLEDDSMRAQADAARQALPALRMVEQYAAANGMTAQQYLQFAQQNIHRQAVEQLTQKGVPEETARELVDERMQLEAERRTIAPLLQRMNAEEARRKARDPWLEMTREYPDVVNVPESVLLSVQKGERPLAAMRAWELEQLRAKLSAQEMQLSAQAAALKNRQTTPGSAAGAADTRRDPFLEALFGTD